VNTEDWRVVLVRGVCAKLSSVLVFRQKETIQKREKEVQYNEMDLLILDVLGRTIL